VSCDRIQLRWFSSCLVSPPAISIWSCVAPLRFFFVLVTHSHETATVVCRPQRFFKTTGGPNVAQGISCECGTRTQKNRRGRHKVQKKTTGAKLWHKIFHTLYKLTMIIYSTRTYSIIDPHA